jgi:hypothetical protein
METENPRLRWSISDGCTCPTINTSDSNKMEPVRPLSQSERIAALEVVNAIISIAKAIGSRYGN